MPQGPTAESVRQLTAATAEGVSAKIEAWIEQQMEREPPTLHREYWRKRASPRVGPSAFTGGVRSICDVGARFHEFAFTKVDRGKVLEVAPGAGGYTMSIEGAVRTEVSTFDVPQSMAPFVVCDVDERVGGSVTVGGGCTDNAFGFMNPAIKLSGARASLVHAVNSSTATFVELSSLSGTNREVLILSALHAPCPLPTQQVCLATCSCLDH